MTMDGLAVLLVVAGAVFWLVRRAVLRKKGCHCEKDGGCSKQ